ncbi:uncharacterized protein [Engystomops pustulosus]|uniref:uncharacterized protein n=1 Tax=Engystomops pustulosus TaxID=76066 RepID=UPI003AFABF8E
MELLPVLATAGFNEVWIGLFLCSPGDWRWSNGASGTYTKWNSGKPNLTANPCVKLSGGKWSDVDCGARYYFVCYKLTNSTVPDLPLGCQWPLRSSTVRYATTPPPDYTISPAGMGPGTGPAVNWTPDANTTLVLGITTSGGNMTSKSLQKATKPSGGTAPGYFASLTTMNFTELSSETELGYVASSAAVTPTGQSGAVALGNLYLVQTPMTWRKSRRFCRVHYSDLAFITSDAEQSSMVALLSNHIPSKGFWFGLKRNRFWGHWIWSGGQAWGQYSSWGESQPSDPLSKLCGLISGDPARNFSWSSECCGENLPFVCYGE